MIEALQDPWGAEGRDLVLTTYGKPNDFVGVKVVCMRLREDLEEWLDQRTRWVYCSEYSEHEDGRYWRGYDEDVWPQGVSIAIWDPQVAILFKLTWM
jgi:hypothetical protein